MSSISVLNVLQRSGCERIRAEVMTPTGEGVLNVFSYNVSYHI
jgi:hypothetical protein